MAGQVRAPRTNFGRTQNSYSRKQRFVQNIRIGIVENHHHQNHNHRDTSTSKPLIEHTDDGFEVDVTTMNIYNNYGDLFKVCRDILIDRLFYLLPLSGSAGLHITLKDVVAWVRKDFGLKITEQDIKITVDRYMRDRLEISSCVLFACSKRWRGVDVGWCDSLKENAFENSCWKHGMSQNACSGHEPPELSANVVGSAAGGVSVNTEKWPTKLCAAAPAFRPRSAHRVRE